MIKAFKALIPVEYSHFEATIAFYTETPRSSRGQTGRVRPRQSMVSP